MFDSFIYFDVLIGIWSCCKEFSSSLLRRLSVLAFPLFLAYTSPLNDYFIAENFTNHQDYLRLRSEDKSINPMVILKKSRYFNGKCIWNKDYELALINKNVKTRFDIMETLRTYNPNEMFKKVNK